MIMLIWLPNHCYTASENTAPPPEKSAGGFQQAGKKEGGLGVGIFARLLSAPKAWLGWERLRSLAPSREAKQNIFQFLLEEKGSRAKIEKREKCFALHRRQAGGNSERNHSSDCRSKKVRASFSNCDQFKLFSKSGLFCCSLAQLSECNMYLTNTLKKLIRLEYELR
ncbi:MAG TPA: hypothetical protein DEF59_01245 [Candidatus Magasanikbacteria bacterium]|nr:hypothetical protein [Candidatus Magasanikbacteria bacterium]